ncbi:MAG: glycosyltransferase [Actinomycetota bacterium]|nr:glycosyltransferase [Actinomycetota bacterium]
MPSVTIGFVPRDRFCKAAEALERLFDCTSIQFRLIAVDCNIPDVFRREMDRVLEHRRNVRTIRTERYLLTNQMHNLIIRESDDEFVCLVENDILVEGEWLPRLIAACEEHPADVAVPLIIERQSGFEKIHFDDRLGHVQPVPAEGRTRYEIVSRSGGKELKAISGRRTVDMIESHCVLFRREVFDRIGPFDETMSARAEVDLSLALHHAKIPIVFEPRSRVVYSPPPPIYPEERDYYLFKWNIERAAENHRHLEEKWRLVHLPSSVDFVKMRRSLASDLDPEVQLRREAEYRTSVEMTAKDIAALVPAGDALILVDGQQLNTGEVAGGRWAIPFLERDGVYWGPPADDETAIREFERLRQQSGASHMAFAWPAFWWLDYYGGLRDHLRARFPCVLENERLLVFDLRSGRRTVR